MSTWNGPPSEHPLAYWTKPDAPKFGPIMLSGSDGRRYLDLFHYEQVLYSAFCLQWVAISWCAVIGKEQP